MSVIDLVKQGAHSALHSVGLEVRRLPKRERDVYRTWRPKTFIGTLLERECSDKGIWYEELYDVVLDPIRTEFRCVVEIGIGTMIKDSPSSMVESAGDNYRPGASLRAWRDYFPNAEIHGIDPAPDTHVDGEHRITTHHFDSRDSDATANFFAHLSARPDLIIDDGLHTAEAQIATCENFLPHVRPNGFYVLEDIPSAHDAKRIAAELERIRPGCAFAIDCRPEPWRALVVRTPR